MITGFDPDRVSELGSFLFPGVLTGMTEAGL